MIFQCGARTYDFSTRTHIMGVLNCTPDSFYGESRRTTIAAATEAGMQMASDGADFLDVGGESTRPGAEPVPDEEELSRVLPVIRQLAREIDVPISIDTYKSTVAEQALEAGASIVNDISGLRFDAQLGKLVAKSDVPVILMHSKGRPREMQINPSYENVLQEVLDYFVERLAFAESLGIKKERVILDPGIGFGKRLNDNYQLTNHLDAFLQLGCPLLYGASRKSLIGKVSSVPPESSLEGTIAANTIAVLHGAHILRVHDVLENKRAIQIVDYAKRNPA